MSTLRDTVTETLRSIYDRQSKGNILDLKIVEGLYIEDSGHVKLSLKVPYGEEKAFEALKQHIQGVLIDLPGVTEISVFFVQEKPSSEGTRIHLSQIKNLILIASGKGGVGKSTVATNLSCALARAGHKVGLLDADIYGPSVPVMLGALSKPETNQEGKIIPLVSYGVKNLSIGQLLTDHQGAVIWRGPMIQKALYQLLLDADWGVLDYLLVDLPPGTGDIQLSLVQKVHLSGAVLVTTPQDIALLDVKKAAEMFQKTGVPILGLIENMSTFVCPHCHKTTDIFHAGGGQETAQSLQVPVLGHIPLDMAVRMGSDAGRPIATQAHPIAGVYAKIAGDMSAQLE